MGYKSGSNEILRTIFLCVFKVHIIEVSKAGSRLAPTVGPHFYIIATMCL